MDFDEIVGNFEIKENLLKKCTNDNVLQSYLFVGTEGIGKFLIAKEFAKKMLNFNELYHPDLCIINEQGNTIKVDTIREMISKVIEQPIKSSKKVYIINDCEKMTIEAQNCLLKTLEEPPKFVVIILISSKENAILDTIKSRCTIIKFKDISNDELKRYAESHLGYTQMTESLLESFNGSIGQAIKQKENQEKFSQIDSIIDGIFNQDIIDVMNNSKVIYDKENIYDLLNYMIVKSYKNSLENRVYLDCIQKIKNCEERLKSNCNFDMCVDTMLFEMWECVRKGT